MDPPDICFRTEAVQREQWWLPWLHHQHVLWREVSWRKTFGEEAHHSQGYPLSCFFLSFTWKDSVWDNLPTVLQIKSAVKCLNVSLCPCRLSLWSVDTFMRWPRWRGLHLFTAPTSVSRSHTTASMILLALSLVCRQMKSQHGLLCLFYLRCDIWSLICP